MQIRKKSYQMQFFMPEHVFIWRILIKHENNKTTKKFGKYHKTL